MRGAGVAAKAFDAMRVSGAPTEWMTTIPSDLAKLFCAMSACWAPEMRSDAPSAPLPATLEPVIENQGPKVLSSVPLDRKSVVVGKSVSVRVDLGGRRIIKKKK